MGLLVLLALVVGVEVAHRWRIFTPWNYKAFVILRTERIEAGKFFNVTCGCGHSFELSGVILAGRISGLGNSIWCPVCISRVRVISILEARNMTEQEREQQRKDYEVLKDEWRRIWEQFRWF